jgi:hypothetical protein
MSHATGAMSRREPSRCSPSPRWAWVYGDIGTSPLYAFEECFSWTRTGWR